VRLAGSVDERRAVDDVYLDFNKAFGNVCCNILIDKCVKCGLCEWTVKWTESWLNCEARRVLINSTKSSWRAIISGIW